MEKRETDRPFVLGLSRNVFFTGLVSLLMDVSSEMVYPLLPLFLTNVLGATKTTVGIIEGIAEATASLLKIFSGWVSDKFGKRKLLMGLGYGISTVSRPIIALASTWFSVLGARFVDRVGKGVRTAPRDAIIAESTPEYKLGLAFGFHRTMDTIGAVIGPGLAFILLYLTSENMRFVFLASTIPGILAVAVIIFFLKEKAKKAREKGAEIPRLTLASFDGKFRSYLFVIAIFSLGNFADAFLLLQAQNLGIRQEIIPIVYLLFNIVYALSSAPIGAFADRIGLRTVVLAGFISYSVIYFLVANAFSPVHMWILFPLYGVYKAMTEGVQRAFLSTLAPKERKATAFGVYHTVTGLMLLPASIIAGRLWDAFGPRETFLYGSVMGALAAVTFIIFVNGKKKG